jgi:hypothetical protein
MVPFSEWEAVRNLYNECGFTAWCFVMIEAIDHVEIVTRDMEKSVDIAHNIDNYRRPYLPEVNKKNKRRN